MKDISYVKLKHFKARCLQIVKELSKTSSISLEVSQNVKEEFKVCSGRLKES